MKGFLLLSTSSSFHVLSYLTFLSLSLSFSLSLSPSFSVLWFLQSASGSSPAHYDTRGHVAPFSHHSPHLARVFVGARAHLERCQSLRGVPGGPSRHGLLFATSNAPPLKPQLSEPSHCSNRSLTSQALHTPTGAARRKSTTYTTTPSQVRVCALVRVATVCSKRHRDSIFCPCPFHFSLQTTRGDAPPLGCCPLSFSADRDRERSPGVRPSEQRRDAERRRHRDQSRHQKDTTLLNTSPQPPPSSTQHNSTQRPHQSYTEKRLNTHKHGVSLM